MTKPMYNPGDMIQNLNSPIPVLFIVLDCYWLCGDYTYELLAPDVPDKSYFKTEQSIRMGYKVVA